MTTKIVFLLCGSFNPITFMHLRMFEIARDFFRENNLEEVIGGVISPVNDTYPKKYLLPAAQRCEMVRRAIEDNPFLILDDWEITQSEWCRTKVVLENTGKRIKNELYDSYTDLEPNKKCRILNNGVIKTSKWIETINFKDTFKVKLLCGADLLESFAIPKLWSLDDMKYIVTEHGLAVISRDSTSPLTFIYENDILHKYSRNIQVIQNWMGADVSSTKIRRAVKRQQSIKYIVPEPVIEFIREHKLYCESSDDC